MQFVIIHTFELIETRCFPIKKSNIMFSNLSNLEKDENEEKPVNKKVYRNANLNSYKAEDRPIKEGLDVCGNCHWFNGNNDCGMFAHKSINVQTPSCFMFMKDSY